MKVRAIARGYYGRLREPGDVFDVKDGETGSWFAPVEVSEKGPKPSKGGKAEKTDESLV